MRQGGEKNKFRARSRRCHLGKTNQRGATCKEISKCHLIQTSIAKKCLRMNGKKKGRRKERVKERKKRERAKDK